MPRICSRRPNKHPTPPGRRTGKQHPRKNQRTQTKHQSIAPQRPGTYSKRQVEVGSGDGAQTNGTLTYSAPQDGRSWHRDATWHPDAAQPHTPIESRTLHEACLLQNGQRPPHRLDIG
ncbi:Hypothetical predicted protein [Pelobates cultripes]|uniref:Uncharacterized protein n=1 Tax=Pelobates cultripes TaxID=61616 RepID=A0AAD1R366_PELCU|nr:Hypothetical predicted protein [Pelobates cultripes]